MKAIGILCATLGWFGSSAFGDLVEGVFDPTVVEDFESDRFVAYGNFGVVEMEGIGVIETGDPAQRGLTLTGAERFALGEGGFAVPVSGDWVMGDNVGLHGDPTRFVFLRGVLGFSGYFHGAFFDEGADLGFEAFGADGSFLGALTFENSSTDGELGFYSFVSDRPIWMIELRVNEFDVRPGVDGPGSFPVFDDIGVLVPGGPGYGMGMAWVVWVWARRKR